MEDRQVKLKRKRLSVPIFGERDFCHALLREAVSGRRERNPATYMTGLETVPCLPGVKRRTR
jgi:hypothetical protein